jgi:(5-formylfuran-3-yl)methyl phosphate synthase
MAGLLVSVRSVEEAAVALDGGADVVDVKEPSRGPLGRAHESIWRGVSAFAVAERPLSIALGELADWPDAGAPEPSRFDGFSFRKLGLASSGVDWAVDWRRLRARFGDGPGWVAVAYSDWEAAAAPAPGAVLAEAIVAGCPGILVDTFDKTRRSTVDLSWRRWVDRAHEAGLFVAIAGGLEAVDFKRLAPLGPDLFAVRGAACAGGRQGTLAFDRVSELADRAHSIASPSLAVGARRFGASAWRAGRY